MKPSEPKSMVSLYFMDARSKLIDIAAFMDRVEREGETDDYRYQAFLKALEALQTPQRAKEVLLSFSDTTAELIPEATTKAAAGAWSPEVDTTGKSTL